MKNVLVTSVLALALLQSGCSSLQKSKDETALKSVKKVALVAYSGDFPVPAQLGFNLGSGKVEADRGGGFGSDLAEPKDPIFEEISKAFKSRLNLIVLDEDQMRLNEGYQRAYKKTTEGWQTNKTMIGPGRQKVMVAGVMDGDAMRALEFEGRNALIKSLGVDAIISATTYIDLAGFSIFGFGSRSPQANITIFMYKHGVEAPIWFETFKGEKHGSMNATGFFDESKMKASASQSAKNAMTHLNATTVQ